MVRLSNRPFRDDNDLAAMLTLVSAAASHDGLDAGHLYRGDVVWSLYQHLAIDPTTRARLFEDDAGTLRGFVLLYPPQGFIVEVNTALPDVDATIAEMVRWTEAHLTSTAPADTPVTTLEVEEIPTTNPGLATALTALGYRPSGEAPFQLNHRDLRGEIEEPVLPEGAEVRQVDVDDVAELEARVALHREVWESSKFSLEGYERLRTKPVYRPDLDLVAVTPEGELASYCIVWWDPELRAAEFEPVGTSTRFRRQGYAKAMLLEGMRRLQAIGATDAVVACETNEKRAPSRRLYASAGFRFVTLCETWTRP